MFEVGLVVVVNGEETRTRRVTRGPHFLSQVSPGCHVTDISFKLVIMLLNPRMPTLCRRPTSTTILVNSRICS